MLIHIDKDDVLPNYIHEERLNWISHPDLEEVLFEVPCVPVWVVAVATVSHSIDCGVCVSELSTRIWESSSQSMYI